MLPMKNRDLLTPVSRFTLKLSTAAEVDESHRQFTDSGKDIGITEVGDLERNNGAVSFMFSDLDRNWWEFTASNGS